METLPLFTIAVTLQVPQLDTLGEQLVAAIDTLKEAVLQHGAKMVEVGTAIADEIAQLAQREQVDPAELQALETQVRGMTATLDTFIMQIDSMVPDEPPPTP